MERWITGSPDWRIPTTKLPRRSFYTKLARKVTLLWLNLSLWRCFDTGGSATSSYFSPWPSSTWYFIYRRTLSKISSPSPDPMARWLAISVKQPSTLDWNSYLYSTRLMFHLLHSWTATWVLRWTQCKVVSTRLTPYTWNTTTSTIFQPSSTPTAPLQPWPSPPLI